MARTASYSKILGANERVGSGHIGLRNRGNQVRDTLLDTGSNETVAVCDLRDDYLDFAIKKSRAAPKKYKEYCDVQRRYAAPAPSSRRAAFGHHRRR